MIQVMLFRRSFFNCYVLLTGGDGDGDGDVVISKEVVTNDD